LVQVAAVWAPETVENFPAAQASHWDTAVMPVPVSYVPAVQGEQALKPPVPANVPAPQMVHTEDAMAPETVENVPAGQASHWDCAVMPVPVSYVPALHRRQVLLPLFLYVPAVHDTQIPLFTPPVFAVNFPEGHAVQVDCPASGLYVFTGQTTYTVEPVSQ
jgi:hypothetical protein